MIKSQTLDTTARGRYKSSDETRERILDAAEEVFAAEGLNVSMRKIMSAAGVNVSSINYHFGSRETLLRALLDARSQSINKERLTQLEQVLTAANPATVSDIITALYQPALRPSRREDAHWQRFLKVRAMLTAESSDMVRDSMSRNYDDMHGRFVAALCDAAPHLSEADILWRYHCLLGVQSQSASLGYRIRDISKGQVDLDDPARVLDQIVPLMAKLFD